MNLVIHRGWGQGQEQAGWASEWGKGGSDAFSVWFVLSDALVRLGVGCRQIIGRPHAKAVLEPREWRVRQETGWPRSWRTTTFRVKIGDDDLWG